MSPMQCATLSACSMFGWMLDHCCSSKKAVWVEVELFLTNLSREMGKSHGLHKTLSLFSPDSL